MCGSNLMNDGKSGNLKKKKRICERGFKKGKGECDWADEEYLWTRLD